MKNVKKRFTICMIGFTAASWICCQSRVGPVELPASQIQIQLEKITSNDGDSDEYAYNKEGHLTYHIGRRITTDYSSLVNDSIYYDTHNRVVQIIQNNTYKISFHYHDSELDYVEEFDHKGRLAVTHQYIFEGGRLATLLDHVHQGGIDADYFIKTVYEYDSSGNVAIAKSFTTSPGKQDFTEWQQIRFELYDHKVNPLPGFLGYPFIPTKLIHLHNPGRIITEDLRSKKIIAEQKNQFEYNPSGYPIRNIQTITSDGNVREKVLDYHYLDRK